MSTHADREPGTVVCACGLRKRWVLNVKTVDFLE
jgi:hypothetical protein